MELEFSAATLREVREAVAARAAAAGMTAGRTVDVVLAVHELAANAVLHGAGRGRLRLQVTAGSLHCEVSDLGRDSPNGQADSGSHPPGGTAWPVAPGHGLWLVRQVCDQLSIVSSPGGSRVTAVFSLSSHPVPRTSGRG